MRPEARALGQALLELHAARVKATPPGKSLLLSKYTVRYGDLCAHAKVPHLTRIVGPFLTEIEAWCAESGWPPLNALAVGEGGMPGSGGFKTNNWTAEVEKCIRFAGYPAKMP